LVLLIKIWELKIWEDISQFTAKNPVLTIGSFDGVHLGHRAVIEQLIELSKQNNGESVIFTFSPHPLKVLHPKKNFVLLTTIEEKINIFKEAGVDHLILFPFTREFSKLSYQEFVTTILLKQIHMNTLLVGYDHTIGRNKEGNFEQLKKLGKHHNFNVVLQKQVSITDVSLSSTTIRNLLTSGKLLEASKLLGYPYLISGTVVHGQHLGNKLGFPTANILPPDNKFIPGNGVYAIVVNYNTIRYKGMMNIGVRPTIEDNLAIPVIEAHLFNFNENLYCK
jgi:riboflavin kinase/FMN adenylyltransferase